MLKRDEQRQGIIFTVALKLFRGKVRSELSEIASM